MLKSHFDSVEKVLLALSGVAGNTGHSLHKGTPRETFASEFLKKHLSTSASIGSGEIIASNSLPNEKRNQFDIIIYKSNFPKIEISSGINCFLCESVIATIEVKSTLTKNDLEIAMKSANKAKLLKRHTEKAFATGWVPPGILSFVVCYDGPKKIETVTKWIIEIEKREKMNLAKLPLLQEQRVMISSESLEGIFILGRGCTLFDNLPLSMMSNYIRSIRPLGKWVFADQSDGNLLWLFLILCCAVEGTTAEWVDWPAYITGYEPSCGVLP